MPSFDVVFKLIRDRFPPQKNILRQDVLAKYDLVFRHDRAGRLVDAAGLKGARIGDAQVSEKHANFMVNVGHARAADVLALIRKVRAAVKKVSGVKLELELKVVGEA